MIAATAPDISKYVHQGKGLYKPEGLLAEGLYLGKIHNWDKKLQESKSLLKPETLKEKLGKKDFHYDMEEIFEPVTAKQAEATKNQKNII